MKNTSFCLVILPLLIISCTADNVDAIDNGIAYKVNSKKLEKSARVVENLNPENPANVYDFAGKLHNDLLDTYLTGNYQYNTISQISQQIEAIAAANNDLVLLNFASNVPGNIEEMRAIVNYPEAKFDEALVNSSMTNAAKTSLSSFMNAALLWENIEYDTIYESIVSYESSVMTNSQFSSEDKRVILTSSSIIRYSLYYDKGRKDKDWETSVGNRVGGVSGALDQSLTAIKMALIIGISQNNYVKY